MNKFLIILHVICCVFLDDSSLKKDNIPIISKVMGNSNIILFEVQKDSIYSKTLLIKLKERYTNFEFIVQPYSEDVTRKDVFLDKIRSCDKNKKIVFWYEKEENLSSLDGSDIDPYDSGKLYVDNYFILNCDKLTLLKSKSFNSFDLKLRCLGKPIRIDKDSYIFSDIEEIKSNEN